MVKKATSSDIRVDRVADQYTIQNRLFLLLTVLKGFVAGFLSLFCLIGLMGTLLTELHHRREEIGLRRVLGASGPHIWSQLILEYWYISLYVISLGSILTLQFPLLGIFSIPASLYLNAMALATLSIWALLASFIVLFYYPLLRFTPAHSLRPFTFE